MTSARSRTVWSSAIYALATLPVFGARLAILTACGVIHAASTSGTATTHPLAAVQDLETSAQRDSRMAWWRQARFGMFIHWGLYSVPAGSWQGQPVAGLGEWIMHDDKIPVVDYKRLATQFNPTGFDARAWVSLAKSAGMKYIVVTAKHHDGFAMFGSKSNSFNIVDATPFRRDPLKELSAEAAAQGIKLGFYYSQDQDWTAPGGAAFGGHWDPSQDGSFADYLHVKALPQLQELLSNYEPSPAVLWFDTPTKEMTAQLAAEIVAVTNTHPGLIWNNRLGGGYAGDTETPEQHIPAQGFPGRDWETCMTINDTWGFKENDTNFKSASLLIRTLVDVASKGGNFLLNVGPDAHGVIPSAEADRLRKVGLWLAVNGESIYDTGPTPFSGDHGHFSRTEKTVGENKPKWIPTWDWRATTRPGKVYLHLLRWPGTGFHLDGLKFQAKRVYFLANPHHTPLRFKQDGSMLELHLPTDEINALDTVVVIESGA